MHCTFMTPTPAHIWCPEQRLQLWLPCRDAKKGDGVFVVWEDNFCHTNWCARIQVNKEDYINSLWTAQGMLKCKLRNTIELRSNHVSNIGQTTLPEILFGPQLVDTVFKVEALTHYRNYLPFCRCAKNDVRTVPIRVDPENFGPLQQRMKDAHDFSSSFFPIAIRGLNISSNHGLITLMKELHDSIEALDENARRVELRVADVNIFARQVKVSSLVMLECVLCVPLSTS